MYKLLRNILFLFDAEQVHYFSMNFLHLFLKIPFAKNFFTQGHGVNTGLEKTVFGLRFKNPVGLAAGFDKNAKYITELEALGFGFVEIGTVTPLPQKGNERPRLFRLPKDKALINRMGFNNDGVTEIARRLKHRNTTLAHQHPKTNRQRIIIGGNIGKNKQTPNEEAWKDYEICFNALFDWVDYFVVNVSSPNTPGLRDLQQKDSLRIILSRLQNINRQKANPKPLLFKISPDLEQSEIADVVDLAMELNLAGVVVANTTSSRTKLLTNETTIKKIGAGGLSGKPLNESTMAMVRFVADRSGGRLPIIASGGIFNGSEAEQILRAGASLVQVWTGFIYEGPSIVGKICNTLIDTN
jgi:dihydroorotate dehydrogenase